MPAVNHVLVAGAGLAGTATATGLAAAGVAVDLIDVKPEITAIGSGITMQGNGLRELRRLGVSTPCSRRATPSTAWDCAPPTRPARCSPRYPTHGPAAPTCRPRSACHGPRWRGSWPTARWRRAPSCGSAPRSARCRRTAAAWTSLFSDGSAGRYDLVVGADGIRSATRRMIGISDEPRPTGMGIFRAFGPRPASVTRTDLYYGGPRYIAGYCPTGENSLYAYLVEDARDRSALTPAARLAAMRDLAAAYHGPWDDIRATLTDPAHGQLHAVRGADRPGAVEPGPGGADRRRRARLPADPGPRRRSGPGGRGRAHRAAAFRYHAGRCAVGGIHRPAVRAGEDRRRGVLPARPVAARP